jgi:hypothetical protein
MPLHVDGTNFLEWVNDARKHLNADDLARAVSTEATTSTEAPLPPAAKWQALLLLTRHLDQPLRLQYMQVEDPAELWSLLHARFNHQQTLFLPQARTDWINLRVMDFTDFATFNSELHRISAQLRLCGETLTDAELIEKTLSTFPPATAILSQQYRNMKFKRHANLMSQLLLAEKHHQLLIRNAESRPVREVHNTISYGLRDSVAPTGAFTAPLPAAAQGPDKQGRPPTAADLGHRHEIEAHAAEASRRPPRGSYRKPPFKSSKPFQRGNQFKPKPQFRPGHQAHGPVQGNCYNCGQKGHFAKNCRAPSYITNMYRELQQLRNQPRQNYSIQTQNPPSPNHDIKNYMTLYETSTSQPDVALIDSASTHTILIDPKFFHFSENDMSWQHCTLITMAGSRNFKFREDKAMIILPGGYTLVCQRAMYAPEAPRSLISYRDLRDNGIHVSTGVDNGEEILSLRKGTEILTTAIAGQEGLYKVPIRSLMDAPIDGEEMYIKARAGDPVISRCNMAKGVSVDTVTKPDLWHRRLGHPGTTVLRRMLPLITGHNLHTSDAEKTHDCVACIQGKFIKRPSHWTLPEELPPPFYRLHGDICGPINPPSGTFRYFFVLVDASGVHSEVALLPTRNMVFPKILAILLKYRNHFPEQHIKYLRMDNAQEFKSHVFEDYCTANGITLTY